MSSWAGELAEAILENGKRISEGSDQRLHVAKMASINPPSIKLFDQVVSRYVYLDHSYTALNINMIDDAFSDDGGLPQVIVDLLKQALKQTCINVGDTIIVYQDGVSFYILAKVG